MRRPHHLVKVQDDLREALADGLLGGDCLQELKLFLGERPVGRVVNRAVHCLRFFTRVRAGSNAFTTCLKQTNNWGSKNMRPGHVNTQRSIEFSAVTLAAVFSEISNEIDVSIGGAESTCLESAGRRLRLTRSLKRSFTMRFVKITTSELMPSLGGRPDVKPVAEHHFWNLYYFPDTTSP